MESIEKLRKMDRIDKMEPKLKRNKRTYFVECQNCGWFNLILTPGETAECRICGRKVAGE